MRFISFLDSDDVRPGALDGDIIRVINTPTMRDFVALSGPDRAAAITHEQVALKDVRLVAPLQPPRNVLCVGRNYLEHAKEGARALGKDLNLPDVPTFFTKASTAIAGPGDLELSKSASQQYDWEAELGVVIGATCKDLGEAAAMNVIFGYTCLNDISARDLQFAHGQWFKGKSVDNTCPIGPSIAAFNSVGDPQSLDIALRINGTVKQSSNTSQMIFPIARLIAELSKGMTLLPGDIIATGTPDGVGFARTPPEYLADGDVMEVDIQNVGILRNVVRLK